MGREVDPLEIVEAKIQIVPLPVGVIPVVVVVLIASAEILIVLVVPSLPPSLFFFFSVLPFLPPLGLGVLEGDLLSTVIVGSSARLPGECLEGEVSPGLVDGMLCDYPDLGTGPWRI